MFGQRTMFRAEAGAVRGWVCEGRSSSTATPPRGRCFPGRYGGGGTPPGPAQPLFPSSRLLRDREDLWFVPQGNACALGPCLARQRGSRAVVRTAWHLDGPGRLPSPGLHPALAALVRGLGEGTVSHRPLVLMSLVTSPWSSSERFLLMTSVSLAVSEVRGEASGKPVGGMFEDHAAWGGGQDRAHCYGDAPWVAGQRQSRAGGSPGHTGGYPPWSPVPGKCSGDQRLRSRVTAAAAGPRRVPAVHSACSEHVTSL